jgi:hypothetical protein
MTDLKGFPGDKNGMKKDGRGTWRDDGRHSIRHSVDKMPDGSLQEHVVVKDKKTGQVETRSADYKPDPKRGWAEARMKAKQTGPAKGRTR